MTRNLVPDLLNELKSNETFTRNDAIKKIIKDKINDEQIIAALKGIIENDPSISVRNFARAALDVFGIQHSAMEVPIGEQEQGHETKQEQRRELKPKLNARKIRNRKQGYVPLFLVLVLIIFFVFNNLLVNSTGVPILNCTVPVIFGLFLSTVTSIGYFFGKSENTMMDNARISILVIIFGVIIGVVLVFIGGGFFY